MTGYHLVNLFGSDVLSRHVRLGDQFLNICETLVIDFKFDRLGFVAQDERQILADLCKSLIHARQCSVSVSIRLDVLLRRAMVSGNRCVSEGKSIMTRPSLTLFELRISPFADANVVL